MTYPLRTRSLIYNAGWFCRRQQGLSSLISCRGEGQTLTHASHERPLRICGSLFCLSAGKAKRQCVTTGDIQLYERRRLLAITKERKYELVAEYADLLSKTDGFIVTEYRGLSVGKLDDLRNRLRDASGGGYRITKNTLFSIALQQN